MKPTVGFTLPWAGVTPAPSEKRRCGLRPVRRGKGEGGCSQSEITSPVILRVVRALLRMPARQNREDEARAKSSRRKTNTCGFDEPLKRKVRNQTALISRLSCHWVEGSPPRARQVGCGGRRLGLTGEGGKVAGYHQGSDREYRSQDNECSHTLHGAVHRRLPLRKAADRPVSPRFRRSIVNRVTR